MVSFEAFVDEMIDVAVLIDVLLGAGLVKDVVKIEALVLITILDKNLFAFGMGSDA